MSAPLFFIIRPHVGTQCHPWRRPPLGMGGAALLLLLLPLLIVLFSAEVGLAQSTLTVVDNEPVDPAPGEPGPGDNLVFSVRRNRTFVVTLSFATGQPGEVVSHRLNSDGTLDLVGRTPAGREPRQIALARGGDYAVLVNSIANEIATMGIGNDGLLHEVGRLASGGENPYDVAVAYNDIVVVANRESNRINTFHIDRRGQLRPLSQAATGQSPHVVAVSRRNGLVAVSNQTEQSVSLFELNRRGDVFPLATVAVDAQPNAVAWHKRNLFVVLDMPFPEEDVIRAFRVTRSGAVEHRGDTPAGVFLTDIEANADGLFAVTANRNDPADPFDDRNEVRVYRIENGTALTLDASLQTEGFPPSFKQLATGPDHGRFFDRQVIVSEFQSGWLRSLVYTHGDGEEDEED